MDLIAFQALAEDCAPHIAFDTIAAIVRHESDFDPIALNINGVVLARKPASEAEAVAWATEYMAKGYSVDVGLAQINSGNFGALGLTVADAFEPCANLEAAEKILADFYTDAARQVGEGQEALRMAISAYNTGSMSKGVRNGYVAKVTAVAAVTVPAIDATPDSSGNAMPPANTLIVYSRAGDSPVMTKEEPPAQLIAE